MGVMHAHLGHNDILVISFFARAAAMASSCVTWVVTPELFKTESRATMHSLLSCIARFGAAASPYVMVSKIPNVTIAIILGTRERSLCLRGVSTARDCECSYGWI